MGDEESEEFYAFPARGCELQSDDGTDGEEEQEQAYVDRRAAEMKIHAHMYNTNNCDERMSDHDECQILKSLCFQYMQHCWECLYDSEEHTRLREAIMNEL